MYCIYPYGSFREFNEHLKEDHLCVPGDCPKKNNPRNAIYGRYKWGKPEDCGYRRATSPHNRPKISLANCRRRCRSCGCGMKRSYIRVADHKESWLTHKPTKSSKTMPFGYVCMGCGETVLTDEFKKLQKLYEVT